VRERAGFFFPGKQRSFLLLHIAKFDARPISTKAC
jgi:hypothetical protein